MARISLIIPVYNAADTLPRCLDSVFAQTLAPHEVITVNDGSTDSSLAILDTYATQHSQLRIISQTNQGVSLARNAGIEAATSDWLMFLDADDYLAPTALKTLAQETGGEMALMGMKMHVAGNTYNQNIFRKTETKELYGSLKLKDALSCLNYYCLSGPVCKLFRTDIVKQNNIFFPSDLSFGEDTVFVYSYLKYVNQITLHKEHLYHCDKSNTHSLTATADSAAQYHSFSRIYPVMKEVYLSNHLSLHYPNYIYLDALQKATHLSYKDHAMSSDERISIYQMMFANEYFDALKPQCSPVFLALGRMHAWHLCDWYLRLRTI